MSQIVWSNLHKISRIEKIIKTESMWMSLMGLGGSEYQKWRNGHECFGEAQENVLALDNDRSMTLWVY